jgi:hypothetical protein
MTLITIRFYSKTRSKSAQGTFLGTAELKERELTVDVRDESLRALINNPVTAINSSSYENGNKGLFITYYPGTIQHITTIAEICHSHGYRSEICSISLTKDIRKEVLVLK